MRLNRRQVALRSYAEAVRLDPEHLAADPTDAGILARMAVSEVKLGRPAEARRNAGAAAKLRAHDVEVRYRVAVVRALNGETEAALAELEEALGLGYSAAIARSGHDLASIRGKRQVPGAGLGVLI